MRGIILNNAYSGIADSQSERLRSEFLELGVSVDIVSNKDLSTYTTELGGIASSFDADFCIYLDKDKYVLKALELLGVRTFNSFQAIEDCDDKMMTHLLLTRENIPMPITIPGLLCYRSEHEIQLASVEKIENKLGYPIVVKESFGSLGMGVYLAHNRSELLRVMEKVKLKPHLFQQFISTSFGTDVRVIVIGGKVIASMKRQSATDFRSNIDLGGVGTPFDLPKEFEKIAIDTATALNLDYCGIDILFGENNQPLICEVNSNAFFAEIEKVTGKNIARTYAEHILSKLK